MLRKDTSRRYTALFLLLLLVLSCVAMVYSAQAFRDRIDAVRASDSDNAGWLISQLDVDHKSLGLSIDRTLLSTTYPELAGTSTDLSVVRLRLDIFYSRVNTVIAALSRETISDDLRNRLVELDESRDALAAELDSLTEGDTAGLVQFAGSVQRAAPLVRDITIMALLHYVTQSDMVREAERRLLKRFWIQSLVLLFLMIASAVLAVKLWRELEDRTVKMQRALDTVSKVFEVSLSAVVISDMYGQILMANPAAASIFGVTADELEGEFIEEVMIPADHRDAHRKLMARHQRNGQRKMIGAGPVRMDAVRMDGTPFKAEISVVADHDLDGRPILIGFIRDISDVVAAEERLVIARDEAERHASAKTMFLATMSHEMRTPLHGVMAALDLIDQGPMDDETRLLLQTAKDCSDRALQQVNDVLEITRLGESRMGNVPFRPAEVAQDILRELTPMAAARGLWLKLEVEGQDAERMYLGLPNAFSRALYNLAGNAVKFTDHGGVRIGLTFSPEEDGAQRLRVEVRDTGIGIGPADQERIFAEFETVESVSRFRGSGTGLGLPIVRLAVTRMGGHLFLSSEEGKGSTFCFEITLPFADEDNDTVALPVAPDAASKAIAPPVKPLEVLVVDDNKINVTLMSKMIVRLGHVPSQARNGLEAVAAASGKPYDIILMDVSMPVMDGREATGLIRAGGASADAIIIGVTAFSDEERLKDLTAVGMNAVVTKPINTAELSAAMTQMLDVRLSEKAEAAPDAKAQSEMHRALAQLEEMLDRGSALRFLDQTLNDVDKTLPVLTDKTMGLEDVADRIHSTVGSTAVVGLTQLSRLLAEAEDSARAGDRKALGKLAPRISRRLSGDQDILRQVTEDV